MRPRSGSLALVDLPFPRRVLVAFSQKRATQDQVMRALFEHDGWLAPAAALVGEPDPIEVPKIVLYGDAARMPAGELWLFTDRAAADRAASGGAVLGPYAEGLASIRVFGALDPRLEKIKINNMGPLEEFWFMGRDAFPLVKNWAEAVAIDKGLAGKDPLSDRALHARLARYGAYLLLVDRATGNLIGFPQRDGFRSAAVVCTAADSFDALMGALKPELRDRLAQASVNSGADLLAEIEAQGFDAVAFNPAGPGTRKTLPIALARSVAAVAE
jgi:hypothetical protein